MVQCVLFLPRLKKTLAAVFISVITLPQPSIEGFCPEGRRNISTYHFHKRAECDDNLLATKQTPANVEHKVVPAVLHELPTHLSTHIAQNGI